MKATRSSGRSSRLSFITPTSSTSISPSFLASALPRSNCSRRKLIMGLTLVEKIAARHADGLAAGSVVHAGDFISIRPRYVMTHDNTGAVIPKFKQIGATAIADPAQPVFAIDHDIQNVTPKNLEK